MITGRRPFSGKSQRSLIASILREKPQRLHELQGDRKPVLLLEESYNEWAGVFSPDMRWVAYVSLEAGSRADVYVRPFNVSEETGIPALGESKWQVSRGGGNWPRRSPSEIVFDNVPTSPAVLAVPVNTTATAFESGAPQQLFEIPTLGTDVTADGQRFLVAVPTAGSSAPASIVIMLNWPALMEK